MHKVFVVGCGGSGAKTMAFMVDQLKQTLSEQAPNWWNKYGRLPKAWKFVSVDSPTTPGTVGKGLKPVSSEDGDYISCGTSAGLPSVRNSIVNELATDAVLTNIASWGLKDHSVDTLDVSRGAGQYRGVGRLLVLNKLQELQTKLSQSWAKLGTDVDAELAELAAELGQNTSVKEPVVFVVTSMAGGSGASMAVDVCRLVSALPGVSVGNVGLYAITPDVFIGNASPQEQAMFAGTNPNALGMFAELAAGQAGAGTRIDAEMYRALGVNLNLNSVVAGRVFPVGRTVGTPPNITPIGDGTPAEIYRSLGLGLSSMMLDHDAMDNYVEHIMGNHLGDGLCTQFGWGAAQANHMPWGTFGYGRLAMGRDRYAEYSAQRLAHSAVDHLMRGHVDPNETGKTERQQLDDRLENTFPGFLSRIEGVIPAPNLAGNWIYTTAFQREIREFVEITMDRLRKSLPPAVDQKADSWLFGAQSEVQNLSTYVGQQLTNPDRSRRPFYNRMVQWSGKSVLQDTIINQLRDQIGKYGIAYGDELITRLRGYIAQNVVPAFGQLGAYHGLALSEQVRSDIHQLRKIRNEGEVMKLVENDLRRSVENAAVVSIGQEVAEILRAFDTDFLDRLQGVIQSQRSDLESDCAKTFDTDLGVSRLKTDYPQLWPNESIDVVDKRFDAPATEASITPIGEFSENFVHHIETAQANEHSHPEGFNNALNEAKRAVVSGEWNKGTGAEEPPRDMLRLLNDYYWIPSMLNRDPNSGEIVDHRLPQFELKIRTRDVLERSRKFIARPGTSFNSFVSQSLHDFIHETGLTETERDRRTQLVASKFLDAMNLALPLAQINAELLSKLTGQDPSYEFVFTKIPFNGNNRLMQELTNAVQNFHNGKASSLSVQNLENALGNSAGEREISINGSFQKCPPIVLDSVLPRAADQWERSTEEEKRIFWTMRRARQLPGALPMSDAERLAMISGWYIARITGRLNLPKGVTSEQDYEPIQICDTRRNSQTTGKWLTFPQPLLTPPSRMHHPRNYLPAVLESSTLAWSQVGRTKNTNNILESLEPYLALRGMWDDASAPTDWRQSLDPSGRIANPTNGQRILKEWLVTGERQTDLLLIPGTEKAVTMDQRYEAIKAYLEKEKQVYQAYCPSAQASQDGLQVASNTNNQFGDVSNVAIANELPLLADIAPDVVRGMEDLLLTIEWAKMPDPKGYTPQTYTQGNDQTSNSGLSLPGMGADDF